MMSDDYVKMMRERVEALEKRMNRFELVHEQHVAQAIESRNQRDERIEELEEKCGTTLELMERLEELEHWHEDHEVERLRQDRWHATRDAALTGMLAHLSETGPEVESKEVLACARAFANGAHGPLEAKAALCTHENYSCVKERQEVEALVKAALRVRDDYAGGAHVSLASAAAMELALKPFEAVQP